MKTFISACVAIVAMIFMFQAQANSVNICVVNKTTLYISFQVTDKYGIPKCNIHNVKKGSSCHTCNHSGKSKIFVYYNSSFSPPVICKKDLTLQKDGKLNILALPKKCNFE